MPFSQGTTVGTFHISCLVFKDSLMRACGTALKPFEGVTSMVRPPSPAPSASGVVIAFALPPDKGAVLCAVSRGCPDKGPAPAAQHSGKQCLTVWRPDVQGRGAGRMGSGPGPCVWGVLQSHGVTGQRLPALHGGLPWAHLFPRPSFCEVAGCRGGSPPCPSAAPSHLVTSAKTLFFKPGLIPRDGGGGVRASAYEFRGAVQPPTCAQTTPRERVGVRCCVWVRLCTPLCPHMHSADAWDPRLRAWFPSYTGGSMEQGRCRHTCSSLTCTCRFQCFAVTSPAG